MYRFTRRQGLSTGKLFYFSKLNKKDCKLMYNLLMWIFPLSSNYCSQHVSTHTNRLTCLTENALEIGLILTIFKKMYWFTRRQDLSIGKLFHFMITWHRPQILQAWNRWSGPGNQTLDPRKRSCCKVRVRTLDLPKRSCDRAQDCSDDRTDDRKN